MRRTHVSMIALLVVLVASFSTLAAQQVMRPDGVGMVLTGVDVSQTQPLEGYQVGLWMLTPNFKGNAEAMGKASTVAVVQNGVITSLAKSNEGQIPPEVPAIPADGYVLIGSGIGHGFLSVVKVGDKLEIVEKEATEAPKATTIVVDGSPYAITAYNHGRQTDELIIFTRDFGTHTLTNEWGAEAAVVDGKVVAIRDYLDTSLFEIPEDGFIFSVHGAARMWFEANVTVGATVELR